MFLCLVCEYYFLTRVKTFCLSGFAVGTRAVPDAPVGDEQQRKGEQPGNLRVDYPCEVGRRHDERKDNPEKRGEDDHHQGDKQQFGRLVDIASAMPEADAPHHGNGHDADAAHGECVHGQRVADARHEGLQEKIPRNRCTTSSC